MKSFDLKPLRKLAQRYLGLLCFALLSACASTGKGADASAPNIDVVPLSYNESIDISGRFTAQFEQNGRPQSWSGSFDWTQSPENTMVTLLSPLGQVVATIMLTPQGATMTQADKAPQSAANVDALVQDTLGWPLPISNLRNWMQAQVIDRAGKRIVATPQMTKTIDTSDGWRLLFLSWQDAEKPGAPPAPKRIDMERDTEQAGRVQMRLIISSWQPH